MVMLEALACGTPVLCFPSGAAPEIVEHGRSGYVCRYADAMVDAVSRIDRIDRRRCRIRAGQLFSLDRMIDKHLALYESLLGMSRSDRLSA